MSEYEEKEIKTKRDKRELSPAEVEAGQKEILFAVSSDQHKRLRDKVAWILNHFPAARDSDITLSLKFWEQFQADLLDGDLIHKSKLFKLTKTTSLTRERARIQNDFKLFLASDPVRKQRGKLEEGQYANAISVQPNYPVSVVYADESGKNDKYLIVGSLWILNGFETIRLKNKIDDWKKTFGIDYEFHFTELSKHKLQQYKLLVDLLYEESSLLGFKALAIEREGIIDVNTSLGDLFYHLVIQGLVHENLVKRAPFPRTVQFWKDSDSPGGDKLLLANLKDKLKLASKSLYSDNIHIDLVEAQDSKKLIHIQLTDLFTGAINRKLNYVGPSKNHKDEFSEYFLEKFKISSGGTLEGDANTLTFF